MPVLELEHKLSYFNLFQVWEAYISFIKDIPDCSTLMLGVLNKKVFWTTFIDTTMSVNIPSYATAIRGVGSGYRTHAQVSMKIDPM